MIIVKFIKMVNILCLRLNIICVMYFENGKLCFENDFILMLLNNNNLR